MNTNENRMRHNEDHTRPVRLRYEEEIPETTDLNVRVHYIPSDESTIQDWKYLGYIEERGYGDKRTYAAFDTDNAQVTPTSNSPDEAYEYFQKEGQKIQLEENRIQLKRNRLKNDRDLNKGIER